MDNPQEQKCCRLRNCITSYELFQNLCLDRNVLEVPIKARCDMRADDIDFSSNSFRKQHIVSTFYGDTAGWERGIDEFVLHVVCA